MLWGVPGSALLGNADAKTCVTPPSSIVSWWPGDGNSLDIFNGNHGTIVDDVYYTAGKVDQAFSFDDHGEVWIGDYPSLDVQRITIEAWVYPTLLDGGVDIILNKEPENYGYIQYEIGIRGSNDPQGGNIPKGNFTTILED